MLCCESRLLLVPLGDDSFPTGYNNCPTIPLMLPPTTFAPNTLRVYTRYSITRDISHIHSLTRCSNCKSRSSGFAHWINKAQCVVIHATIAPLKTRRDLDVMQIWWESRKNSANMNTVKTSSSLAEAIQRRSANRNGNAMRLSRS